MNKTFEIRGKRTLFGWLCAYLGNLFFLTCLFIAIALMTFSALLVECEVTGPSMQPTLNKISGDKHDLVYVNKCDEGYTYNDIIVIETKDSAIIKRVIGMPGDIIDFVCINGIYKVERNGVALDEDYILMDYSALTPTYSQNGMNAAADRWLTLHIDRPELFNEEGKLVVGEDKVFALGDNRRVSLDSTVYGTFDASQVTGRVEVTRYYGEQGFDFFFDYIMNGRFFYTIANIF
ncbi:MAG: signal peptidase I [Clostridiales bacterium]|nr:signal peptidase I [Clostridiales bacterium]